MRKQAIGEGIFLRPNAEEAALIWEAVETAGYEKTGEGVLTLLLDLLTDEDSESAPAANPLAAVVDVLKNNPQAIHAAKTALAAAAKIIRP